jgi:c-di-GMP-binding flagellar brake protein YcgR
MHYKWCGPVEQEFSMGERRKETRRKLMAFTPVYELNSGNLLGYLGDLTLKGAMVIGAKPLQVDRQIILDIEFQDELPGIMSKHMTIPARVARCVRDESPNSYKTGFEFTDIQPEHAQIIEALLERYHFRHQMY